MKDFSTIMPVDMGTDITLLVKDNANFKRTLSIVIGGLIVVAILIAVNITQTKKNLNQANKLGDIISNGKEKQRSTI